MNQTITLDWQIFSDMMLDICYDTYDQLYKQNAGTVTVDDLTEAINKRFDMPKFYIEEIFDFLADLYADNQYYERLHSK